MRHSPYCHLSFSPQNSSSLALKPAHDNDRKQRRLCSNQPTTACRRGTTCVPHASVSVCADTSPSRSFSTRACITAQPTTASPSGTACIPHASVCADTCFIRCFSIRTCTTKSRECSCPWSTISRPVWVYIYLQKLREVTYSKFQYSRNALSATMSERQPTELLALSWPSWVVPTHRVHSVWLVLP